VHSVADSKASRISVLASETLAKRKRPTTRRRTASQEIVMENSSKGVFDLDRIVRLVELMKEHDLREVDLQEGEQKIRLARGGKEVAYAAPVMASTSPAQQQQAPSADAAAPAVDAANVKQILSPMVGTFYARPNPNAEPFVKVGDHVENSTTVCIIEAMKTFNEIPAEVRGKIVAVLVEDGEHVDTDKPLFKIEVGK
jgi:acetyl-CoA carboxylase biotin carboxyl carrier protein